MPGHRSFAPRQLLTDQTCTWKGGGQHTIRYPSRRVAIHFERGTVLCIKLPVPTWATNSFFLLDTICRPISFAEGTAALKVSYGVGILVS